MQPDDILATVNLIARQELERDDVTLEHGQDLADINGWDSIIMSAVLIEVERRLEIEFTPAEIDGISTVDGLIAAIDARLRVGS